MGERDFPVRMSRGKRPLSSSLDRSISLLAMRHGISPSETAAMKKAREEQQRQEEAKAMRAIAGRARDAEDCRLLLEACGLLAYEGKPRTSFVPRGRVITAYRRP